MIVSNAESKVRPILLVDTDVAAAASLAAGLETAGFPTVCTFSCRDAPVPASAYIEAVVVAAASGDPSASTASARYAGEYLTRGSW